MGLFERLRALLFRSAHPPLVPVTKRCTGDTIERAIYVFERDWSEENVSNVAIQERIERPDGLLVRYEVQWKISVFDDHPYGQPYGSWALVQPTDPTASDPDARFRVAAATQERHMKF
jgi:hypothetical protein